MKNVLAVVVAALFAVSTGVFAADAVKASKPKTEKSAKKAGAKKVDAKTVDAIKDTAKKAK